MGGVLPLDDLAPRWRHPVAASGKEIGRFLERLHGLAATSTWGNFRSAPVPSISNVRPIYYNSCCLSRARVRMLTRTHLFLNAFFVGLLPFCNHLILWAFGALRFDGYLSLDLFIHALVECG